MKIKPILYGMVTIILAITIFTGCGMQQDSAKADTTSGFTVVSQDIINGSNVEILMNKDTGCYYTFNGGGDRSSMIQMFVVSPDGDYGTIPYCVK